MTSTDRKRAMERARRAADPQRKKKHSEYMKLWREMNPEAARAIDKRKVAKNPEKKRAQDQDYYARNSEVIRVKSAEWSKANPQRKRVYRATRKNRALGNGGALSADICSRLLILQKVLCACCKKPLGDDYHLDHIMPLKLGGRNSDDNVQLLTKTCNLQKSARHPIEFMQARGLLL